MVETARGPDGEYAIRKPGQGWVQVPEQEYLQARQSRTERALGAFGDALQDSGGFLLDALTPLTGRGLARDEAGEVTGLAPTLGQQVLGANDARQEARSRADPLAAGIGGGAGLAAEALLPGAVAGRLARGGARMAAPRVVGPGTAAQRPLVGRFTDTAARVVDGVRGRTPAAADGAMGAQRTAPGLRSADVGERALRGMLEPEQLDELAADLSLGKLYTPGDALALRAAAGGDDIARAEVRRESEELFRSNVALDRMAGGGRQSINAIRDEGAEAANRVVLNELGENIGTRLTATNMRRIGDELGQTFEDAAEAAGDLRFTGDDRAALEWLGRQATADDARLVDGYVGDINANMNEAGALPQKAARQIRNNLGKDISNAAQAGDFSRAQTLGDLQDVLDGIVERQLPQEVAEGLFDARYKYRIFKALERSTATVDAGGKVNLASFMRAYQRRNRFGSNTANEGQRGEGFFRKMETLRYLQTKVQPSSGTVQRLLANSPAAAAAGTAAGVGGFLLGQ